MKERKSRWSEFTQQNLQNKGELYISFSCHIQDWKYHLCQTNHLTFASSVQAYYWWKLGEVQAIDYYGLPKIEMCGISWLP